MVKEGNRLSAILDSQLLILNDPQVIPEQARQVGEHSKAYREKLDKLADLISAECSCGHPKLHHKKAQEACQSCTCKEWAIDGLEDRL